ALPLHEQSGVAFASTNGAMHACGHDLHMAGTIGAVRRLVRRREDLAGTVVFAFQPGEEGYGGGKIMIDEGVLDAGGVRASECYSIHVWPTVPAGRFLTRTGAIMAGLNELRVSIAGVGGHASAPHLLRDTVPVMSEIVMALQSFVSRRVDVHDPVVLSVTRMNAESVAINVIPERSTFAASVRTLSPHSVALLADELPKLVHG
ncbi:M20 family metallopeptidase, partial [Paenibacillus septentrionalis]